MRIINVCIPISVVGTVELWGLMQCCTCSEHGCVLDTHGCGCMSEACHECMYLKLWCDQHDDAEGLGAVLCVLRCVAVCQIGPIASQGGLGCDRPRSHGC